MYADLFLPKKNIQNNEYILNFTSKDFSLIKTSKNKKRILNRIYKYNKLIKSAPILSDIQKINRVNRYFNQFKYESDISNYEVHDYWASKEEFILKGKGDCEDYALAKYYSLLKMGVKEEKLSVNYAVFKNRFHVVLIYKNNKINYILDNAYPKILPLVKRDKLTILDEVHKNKLKS